MSVSGAVRAFWLAIVVFVVCLAASMAVSRQLAETVRGKDEERFRNAVDRLHDAIDSRIATYVAMLRAGSGLFEATDMPTRAQFQAFVARLELQRRYPGIQGIGFSQRVRATDVDRIVSARRAAGDAAFHIWPADPRDEYHTIVYLAPLDRRNLAAIGYDMFTDATRRDAMARARDTGEPAASGPVTLVQEIDEEKQPGFLIYLPLYETAATPPSVEERRARLRGFIYSPFRTGDLFAGIFGAEHVPRAGVELVDAAEPSTLLYATSPREAPAFTTVRTLEVAGRPWTASYFSLPGLDRGSNASLVPAVRWTGIVLGAIVSLLVAMQTSARRRLERSMAALREAELSVQTLLASERQARADAERASRLKDDFLATLSHELRTPLNAILGWAHILERRALTPDRTQHAVASILRNAKTQAQLIDDLLDTTRITSGRLQLDLRDLPVGELIHEAVSAVRPAADARRIVLTTDVEDGPLDVFGDMNRLQQVLSNLLTNAVKFTPEEGRVTARARRAGDQIAISIHDTGLGISPDFLPYVFERFRQADGSLMRQHGGLGLGLSIVRSLVQMHGGSVSAASEGLGRGATFTVRLPAAPGAGARPDAVPPRPDIPLATDALRDRRILAIDDDDDGRELLAQILGHYGASVTTVASAREALGHLATPAEPFDLLISDISMSDLDGYALIEAVRRMPDGRSTIPAIALTAFTAAEDRRRALAAGYTMHVAKPVVPHEIVAACALVAQAAAGPR